MANDPSEMERRTLLQLAAGMAAAPMAMGIGAAHAAQPAATGKPGDFAFLTGEWRIKQRRLKDNGWDHFEGEATVWGALKGVASFEELRIPARDFSGTGIRLLDVERKLWADFWVNAKSGVLGGDPTWGSFINGVGTWISENKEATPPELWRGVWDSITPNSCRWHQSVSRDGGQSWAETWSMDWTRA